MKSKIQKPVFTFARLALVLIFLAGCAAPAVIATPTPSATSTLTLTPPPTASPTPTEVPSATPRPQAKRVLIISIDGMRPDAITLAPMPNLQSLMQSGAYTLTAQTIYPSATLPAHSSMLTGTCSSAHGILWKDYQPEKGYARGVSLFTLAKRYSLYTVMFVGKEKLRQITPPETTDVYRFINDRDLVIAELAPPELKTGFDLAFIHSPPPDFMGHEYGWMSDEQFSVLRRADEALGNLLTGLDAEGMRQDTLIIVTADHGGHEQTHGSKSPEDMTIPWIVAGPGVVPGEISVPVNTTDTAATAAWALHLDLPADWVGLPVLEAFGQTSANRPDPRCP